MVVALFHLKLIHLCVQQALGRSLQREATFLYLHLYVVLEKTSSDFGMDLADFGTDGSWLKRYFNLVF